jgi:5'-nucleotidase
MNILLTNDDGYNAPGIHVLAESLCEKHSVYIVAPEKEMSGCSHSVSFFSGITYRRLENGSVAECYAVDGTPADCVLFSLKYLLKHIEFDVVLSGVNSVLNAGTDVLYSGTFGAAQEATFLKHKGIAVSVHAGKSENYGAAAHFVAQNLEKLAAFADENHTINVNVPSGGIEDIKGVKIVPLSFRPYVEVYKKQTAHDGRDVFFVSGSPCAFTKEQDGGDCKALNDGYITVTPVKILSNSVEYIESMKKTEFVL